MLYVANVGEDDIAAIEENEYVQQVKEYAEKDDAEVIVVSAKIEEEIAELDQEEKALFLEQSGIEQSGIDPLIPASYELLGLGTYFTAWKPDVRAWTYNKGMQDQE